MRSWAFVAITACTLLAAVLASGCAEPQADGAVRIRVRAEILNRVDDRLFGQFMERASFGEPGYDAARDPQSPRSLDRRVVAKLQWMQIPVIRFPAGADLVRIHWPDLIDNVPGRDGGRPVFRGRRGNPDLSNEFGIDEFLALCEELGCEPLLPVRLHPAITESMPVAEAARTAAGLVAYCNAEVGGDLPEGMPDWPAVRARNGRERPWGVRYFQIGNESWHYFNQALEKKGLTGAPARKKADHYLKCLRPYLRAIHEVDPNVEIIVDGVTGAGRWVDRAVLTDATVRAHASYFALHLYQPWGIREVRREGKQVRVGQLSAEDIWYAWVSVPEINGQTGQSRLPHFPDWWLVLDLGLPIACTEWNWNGWWRLGKDSPAPALDSPWAKGVGAAGMLHAFMRNGRDLHMACQSMLVGQRWGITAVRVNDEQSDGPYYMPTGRITGFYSRHHGNERLLTEVADMPAFAQPLRMSSIGPARRVAMVDVVATRARAALYVHLINRRFGGPLTVLMDLEELACTGEPATHRVMTGDLDGPNTKITTGKLLFTNAASRTLTVELPARSVSVVEVPVRKPSAAR
jgi:alpha-N-arabinofuranosidase